MVVSGLVRRDSRFCGPPVSDLQMRWAVASRRRVSEVSVYILRAWSRPSGILRSSDHFGDMREHIVVSLCFGIVGSQFFPTTLSLLATA